MLLSGVSTELSQKKRLCVSCSGPMWDTLPWLRDPWWFSVQGPAGSLGLQRIIWDSWKDAFRSGLS